MATLVIGKHREMGEREGRKGVFQTFGGSKKKLGKRRGDGDEGEGGEERLGWRRIKENEKPEGGMSFRQMCLTPKFKGGTVIRKINDCELASESVRVTKRIKE